jgi:hypothetical protein
VATSPELIEELGDFERRQSSYFISNSWMELHTTVP